MKTSRRLWALCLTLATLGASAQTPKAPAACEDPARLRFALVPYKNVDEHQTQYQPLVQLLESALKRPVELQSSKSYGAVIEGLVTGSVDIAELGPAAYGIALNRGALLSVLATLHFSATPTVEAGTSYRSLLVTRRDRRFRSVEDLRGATLGLTDPASTSGGVIPRRTLEKQLSMALEDHFKRVTFSGSHDRSLELVRKGMVDAAFISSTVVDAAMRRGLLKSGEIAILWRSPPIPYDPFVVRQSLCPELRAQIREIFLGNAPALEGMFRQLGATGFAPASEGDYQEIRSLLSPTP